MSSEKLLSVPEAELAIKSRLRNLPAESRPLMQCIGATLREDIRAERDIPPFDQVCMDGIAIDSASAARGARHYRIQATQPAGSPALNLGLGDFAIEVMTGSVLPNAADCIVPHEHYSLSDGSASLTESAITTRYQNVKTRGSEGVAGCLLVKSGRILDAPKLAVAASAGMASLQVSAQPAFIVISTGDELIDPGQAIATYQVRRSNAYAVVATLRGRGFRQVADDHLVDDAAVIEQRIATHLMTHDVLILSGGVSMGKFDLVPSVMKRLGVQEVFHRVAQKPGKPLWFGCGPQGQAVFGLPGNPVATLVCLIRYVLPAINETMGTLLVEEEHVALASPVSFDFPLTYFLPVKMQPDGLGRLTASPRASSSGDFLNLADTDGFIELPPGPATFTKGFVARLFRW